MDRELVCNIKFTDITDEGSVPLPVFLAAVDKSSKDILLEKLLKRKAKAK